MRLGLYVIPVLIVAVFFLIRANIIKRQKYVYIFKPISTLLVIAVLLLSFLEPTQKPIYSVVVLLGLLFSLGGDIALMFQENHKFFFQV